MSCNTTEDFQFQDVLTNDEDDVFIRQILSSHDTNSFIANQVNYHMKKDNLSVALLSSFDEYSLKDIFRSWNIEFTFIGSDQFVRLGPSWNHLSSNSSLLSSRMCNCIYEYCCTRGRQPAIFRIRIFVFFYLFFCFALLFFFLFYLIFSRKLCVIKIKHQTSNIVIKSQMIYLREQQPKTVARLAA